MVTTVLEAIERLAQDADPDVVARISRLHQEIQQRQKPSSAMSSLSCGTMYGRRVSHGRRPASCSGAGLSDSR